MKIYTIGTQVDMPEGLPTLMDFETNQLIIFDDYQEWYDWLAAKYPPVDPNQN